MIAVQELHEHRSALLEAAPELLEDLASLILNFTTTVIPVQECTMCTSFLLLRLQTANPLRWRPKAHEAAFVIYDPSIWRGEVVMRAVCVSLFVIVPVFFAALVTGMFDKAPGSCTEHLLCTVSTLRENFLARDTCDPPELTMVFAAKLLGCFASCVLAIAFYSPNSGSAAVFDLKRARFRYLTLSPWFWHAECLRNVPLRYSKEAEYDAYTGTIAISGFRSVEMDPTRGRMEKRSFRFQLNLGKTGDRQYCSVDLTRLLESPRKK